MDILKSLDTEKYILFRDYYKDHRNLCWKYFTFLIEDLEDVRVEKYSKMSVSEISNDRSYVYKPKRLYDHTKNYGYIDD